MVPPSLRFSSPYFCGSGSLEHRTPLSSSSLSGISPCLTSVVVPLRHLPYTECLCTPFHYPISIHFPLTSQISIWRPPVEVSVRPRRQFMLLRHTCLHNIGRHLSISVSTILSCFDQHLPCPFPNLDLLRNDWRRRPTPHFILQDRRRRERPPALTIFPTRACLARYQP